MPKLEIGLTRIENGEVTVFSHYPDQFMWTGTGTRHVDMIVTFDDAGPAYIADPIVHVGISAFDADHDRNARISASVIDVTIENFTVRVTTHVDTKLAHVNVSWLAIGRVNGP